MEKSRRSPWMAVAIAALVVAAAMTYVALTGGSGGDQAAEAQEGQAAPPVANPVGLAEIPAGMAMVVRSVDPEATREDGRLYELSADGGTRRLGELACKRVHVSESGAGLCMERAENGIDYDGVIFDSRYREVERFPVFGVPDRARVSPDGRYGAYTNFDEAGSEGYFASPTEFSTNTRIVDMRSGRELLDLEDLEVTRNGDPFTIFGDQLWGVTFAGGDRFYATLASDDRHFLIDGSIETGRARIVGDHVECPSLSPDGTRIAYKRRIGKSNRWRLHVRDVDGGGDVALAETRSIDDQPEWLGDELVTYSDDEATFAVPADGSGRPSEIADRATSGASLSAGGGR